MDKFDTNLIKLNGKNFNSWAYQFELYLKGEKLWGHISGSKTRPTDEDKVLDWETKNLKLLAGIWDQSIQFFSCISNHARLQKEMWAYMKRI